MRFAIIKMSFWKQEHASWGVGDARQGMRANTPYEILHAQNAEVTLQNGDGKAFFEETTVQVVTPEENLEYFL